MRRRPRALAGAAYGALALVDTVLATRSGGHRLRVLTKPLLMPALAARQLSGPPSPATRAAVAAQALSWGGDVALLREGRGSFLAGMASFLGAHVAYISAYRGRSSAPALATRGRRSALLAGAVSATGIALAAARQDRGLGLPVAVYGVTLARMVVGAAAVDGDRGRHLLLAGATVFMVSDTVLGTHRFVLVDAPPAVEGLVMATYTAAQWLIGEGLSRA